MECYYLFVRCTFIVSKSHQTHQFHANHVERRCDCIFTKLNEEDHQMIVPNKKRNVTACEYTSISMSRFFSHPSCSESDNCIYQNTHHAIKSHVEKLQLFFLPLNFFTIFFVARASRFCVSPSQSRVRCCFDPFRCVLVLITAFVQMLLLNSVLFEMQHRSNRLECIDKRQHEHT